jgi:Transposase DDE domain
MRRTEAIAWVVSVCAVSLRLSQGKTLAILVAAAMRCQRVSLANLGRAMLGNAKHQIKRAWRFCANDRVETADAMREVVGRVLRKRKKPLLVALDWVDVRQQFQTLVAGAVLRGRSVPLCWASCAKHVYDGHRSRNAFEESLLLVLRSMVPQGRKVILLADRGFGRTELSRFCQRQGFDYVIRVQPKVHVRCASYEGKLVDYPVHKGICKLLRQVDYRYIKRGGGAEGVTQNVVVRWVRGLPEKRDECWFLVSSLDAGPAQISKLYGRRMTIEQLFRDHKSKRNGWSLRDTQLKTAARLDRLLLVLAIAYLLLCGIGLLAAGGHKPSAWCSNSKDTTCSIFVIGQVMMTKLQCSAAQAFTAFLRASEEAVPKWG